MCISRILCRVFSHRPLAHIFRVWLLLGCSCCFFSGVSNKPGGFSQADVDFLQPFLVTCSNMLYAFTQAEENKRLEAKFASPEIAMEHNNTSNDGTKPNVSDGANVSARMKSMASQNRRERPQLLDSKPLAELYLETTVIYCNITGFTSWASTREPSQVFTLLETGAFFCVSFFVGAHSSLTCARAMLPVFGGFDKIARRQGVCKIETVGDRYVAVSGFPDFQPDHAGRMAQFAQKCVTKFHRCVRQLDLTLGPDTSDLKVRIGIHSGQVLAGVIRGERSRIQLFGDTVNTAAKMERSGRPGQIHISAQTAELLRNEKKQYHIEAADDLVVGAKGTISTYWLTRGPSDTGGQEVLFKDLSESTTSFTDMFDDELYADRTSRLIEWNVKAMIPLIGKIVARQMARKTGQSSSVVNHDVRTVQAIPALESNDSTFLDEVKEIIELPAYDLALQEATVLIDPVAEDQLREYIGCIAALYKPNAFHNCKC
jgi:class 3 adenylate cyclase